LDLDRVLKIQDWIWIAEQDTPLISAVRALRLHPQWRNRKG